MVAVNAFLLKNAKKARFSLFSKKDKNEVFPGVWLHFSVGENRFAGPAGAIFGQVKEWPSQNLKKLTGQI